MRQILALLVLVSLSAPARAEPPEAKAKAVYMDGAEAYALGHYEAALAAFSYAYALAPVSGLLFNIGQCHRQLKHHALAVEFFQRYLDEEGDVPNRAEIDELLVDERALLQTTAAPSVAAPVVDPPAAESSLWEQPLFWGIAAGAVLAVVVGGSLAVIALSEPPAKVPGGSLGAFDLRAP